MHWDRNLVQPPEELAEQVYPFLPEIRAQSLKYPCQVRLAPRRCIALPFQGTAPQIFKALRPTTASSTDRSCPACTDVSWQENNEYLALHDFVDLLPCLSRNRFDMFL